MEMFTLIKLPSHLPILSVNKSSELLKSGDTCMMNDNNILCFLKVSTETPDTSATMVTEGECQYYLTLHNAMVL